MHKLIESITEFLGETGIAKMGQGGGLAAFQTVVMLLISFLLIYLAIGRKFEPLLLLPIAIGMLLTNLPGGEMFHSEFWFANVDQINELIQTVRESAPGSTVYETARTMLDNYESWYTIVWENGAFEGVATSLSVNYLNVLQHGGLLDLLYIGVKTGIYPCLIFIGIGAMTDFTPLISNPKSLLIGAGAQLGVFVAFGGALLFFLNNRPNYSLFS